MGPLFYTFSYGLFAGIFMTEVTGRVHKTETHKAFAPRQRGLDHDSLKEAQFWGLRELDFPGFNGHLRMVV
jgi:hypothetical protein